MKCTVEDIPESERIRVASLSDSEKRAEWDKWAKSNSAALEELMASESCKNSNKNEFVIGSGTAA